MNIKIKKSERPTSNIERSTSNGGTPLAYPFKRRRNPDETGFPLRYNKTISLFNVRCWKFDVQSSSFIKSSIVYLGQKTRFVLMVDSRGGNT